MGHSHSQVKSSILKGLKRIIDPELSKSKKKLVREYFENRCAYCDIGLYKKPGDIDHLIAEAQGGSNAIANRVLSCKSCNSKDKRDGDWKQFLKTKCKNDSDFKKRIQKIKKWTQKHDGKLKIDEKRLELIESEFKKVSKEYQKACITIKDKFEKLS